MPAKIDMVGHVYGRLTVLHEIGRRDAGRMYLCVCVCGNFKSTAAAWLRSGNTTSCGCRVLDGSIRRRHGMKNTKEYMIWKEMKRRCLNPNNPSYSRYGGRGIRLCERWHLFDNFIADMGRRPSAELSLDRIDNDGHYEPGNCRWATINEQARNRSNNRMISLDGSVTTLAELAEKSSVTPQHMRGRLRDGWPVDLAVSVPKGITLKQALRNQLNGA